METLQVKLSSSSLHFLHFIGGTKINEYVALDSIGVSGGQLVGWNDKLFEKIGQFSTNFSISVRLKERARKDIVSFSISFNSYCACQQGSESKVNDIEFNDLIGDLN